MNSTSSTSSTSSSSSSSSPSCPSSLFSSGASSFSCDYKYGFETDRNGMPHSSTEIQRLFGGTGGGKEKRWGGRERKFPSIRSSSIPIIDSGGSKRKRRNCLGGSSLFRCLISLHNISLHLLVSIQPDAFSTHFLMASGKKEGEGLWSKQNKNEAKCDRKEA